VSDQPLTRVLIAEDSSTSRELLSSILRQDGRFEIVGTAVNGLEAAEMSKRLRPDVIMMDIHMPGLDGVKATERIMEESPTPIVVVTGSVQFTDVAVTLNALNAGALAVLRKPFGPGSPGFVEECQQIVSTVVAMAGVKVIRRLPRPEQVWDRAYEEALQTKATARIVAIAASTGGPVALRRILAACTGSPRVPLLLVQHIADGFGPGLAEWLGAATSLTVKLGEHGEALDAGTVYIAPDDRHMGVSRNARILLSDGPPIGGFKPSATYLFRSVAATFGSAALAVILTGMGEDGVAGLREIKQAGGVILAQDEQSCVVFGMPARAIAEGLADTVLPLDQIAVRISGALRGE